jgi:hypothetical protein
MSAPGDEAEAGHRAYFAPPRQGWEEPLPVLRDRLDALRLQLEGVLASGGPSAESPGPAELALQLGEVATAIFEVLSPEERALRQVITTLRTGLALCWDMYGADEAGRVSVQAHMHRLEAEITSFEGDLRRLQADYTGAETDTPSDEGAPPA